MEQILDRFAENPNVLPEKISIPIIPAIAGPETYQGQGWLKSFIMCFCECVEIMS
jgi:hypothetical protein